MRPQRSLEEEVFALLQMVQFKGGSAKCNRSTKSLLGCRREIRTIIQAYLQHMTSYVPQRKDTGNSSRSFLLNRKRIAKESLVDKVEVDKGRSKCIVQIRNTLKTVEDVAYILLLLFSLFFPSFFSYSLNFIVYTAFLSHVLSCANAYFVHYSFPLLCV